jgi:hypothetical protein
VEEKMSNGVNYNHKHKPKGGMISGSDDGKLTVGDIRDAIAMLPDDAEVIFGTCEHGESLQFRRFKMRGPTTISIEFG